MILLNDSGKGRWLRVLAGLLDGEPTEAIVEREMRIMACTFCAAGIPLRADRRTHEFGGQTFQCGYEVRDDEEE